MTSLYSLCFLSSPPLALSLCLTPLEFCYPTWTWQALKKSGVSGFQMKVGFSYFKVNGTGCIKVSVLGPCRTLPSFSCPISCLVEGDWQQRECQPATVPLIQGAPSALHALCDWLRAASLSSCGPCTTSSSISAHARTHTRGRAGCPGVRKQTLFNLFFLSVNWVKASFSAFLMCKWMWHRGTPAHHSTGTFTGHLRVPGRRLWPVYGRWRRGRGV